jgi:predicted  nucleic acid-binding Zn-ribbon protein
MLSHVLGLQCSRIANLCFFGIEVAKMRLETLSMQSFEALNRYREVAERLRIAEAIHRGESQMHSTASSSASSISLHHVPCSVEDSRQRGLRKHQSSMELSSSHNANTLTTLSAASAPSIPQINTMILPAPETPSPGAKDPSKCEPETVSASPQVAAVPTAHSAIPNKENKPTSFSTWAGRKAPIVLNSSLSAAQPTSATMGKPSKPPKSPRLAPLITTLFNSHNSNSSTQEPSTSSSSLSDQLAAKDREIARLTSLMESSESYIRTTNKTTEENQSKLQALEIEVKGLQAILSDKEKKLQSSSTSLQLFEKKINNLNKQIRNYERESVNTDEKMQVLYQLLGTARRNAEESAEKVRMLEMLTHQKGSATTEVLEEIRKAAAIKVKVDVLETKVFNTIIHYY